MLHLTKLPLRPVVFLVSLFAIPLATHAMDRVVPLPYTTIQSAINACNSGDTVLIAPGTYSENINVGGKNIIIKAQNSNFDTIIDGGQSGPVVTFSGGEKATAGLRNLIIQNGKTSNGGGIKGNNTLATIKNCTIRGNTATSNGGGVYGVSGTLQNCTITQNIAANGAGISDCDGLVDSCKITLNEASTAGGGVYDSPGIIQFCEITSNKAKNGGGGIASSDGIVRANLIAKNTLTGTGPVASPTAFGAGLNDMGGTVTLNTILQNESSGDGGGISNSDAVIQNNIIAKNTARRGGGMAACTGPVENNTIWGNACNNLGGGAFNMGSLVANCIIFQNTAPADAQWSGANVPTYSCVQNWAGAQPDIITTDPMLQDPTKNKFNLLPTSPCIDAGKLIPGLTMDFEGESRPYDGSAIPRGDGSDYDIGADEFKPQNVELEGVISGVVAKSKGVVPKLKYSVKATLPVKNSGTDTTPAVALVQFFLSADNVWDPGDALIGKTVQLKNLKGGMTKKVKLSAKFPINTTGSGQYVIAVIDSTNTVAESNESNNVSVAGPLP